MVPLITFATTGLVLGSSCEIGKQQTSAAVLAMAMEPHSAHAAQAWLVQAVYGHD